MTTQPSYRQPVKELSRKLIWKGAVDRLTVDRNNSRIVPEEYARQLWAYSLEKVLRPYTNIQQLDGGILDDWCAFAASEYGKRTAADLRIAYLSGPEPEND
jgi:hypothetical protein